ncbi:MAG: histone deacetylase [Phycisphaerae bacterium]|nr:histone deacetylase [Phycisphaerae bacterium]
MRTGWCYDARFLLHKTGEHHPERPERLRAITARLGDEGLLARLTPLIFGPADRRWIETTHAPAYIDRVRAACLGGQPYIDSADSAICKESFDVALLAVGAVLASADAVMSGQVDNAFCAVRPPGHHAERDLSMGFCLFNNVAIAARYLQQRWSVPRVLILDWDVHHGNGTQHAFEEDPSVLFCSFHEHPAFLYPGTGFEEEIGRGAASGRTLNIAMRPGAGDAEYQQVFTLKFVPAARAFHPDFILVSAGFDAHEADPLAHLRVTDAGFAWLSQAIVNLAHELCRDRLIAVLEGGYDLDALGRCAAKLVATMLDGPVDRASMAHKAGVH